MPSSGHQKGCTNSLRTLRHSATLRACPRRGDSSQPGVRAEERRDLSIPSALGTLQGGAERGEAKDSARGPLAWLGEAALPGAPAPQPRSQQPRWCHVPAAGLGKEPGFFHFSDFPALFQGRKIFGLNFLQYCAGGNISSHVGIIPTFNSGFDSSYRYICICSTWKQNAF